jgi:hypothetical protein
VTGETAVFDTKTNLITMLGGVVLTQCQNVMRGDRLVVDMTTGVSRIESDSRRVQGCCRVAVRRFPARRCPRRHPARLSQINRNNINKLRGKCRRRGLNQPRLACIYRTGRDAIRKAFSGKLKTGSAQGTCCIGKSNRRGGCRGSP